MTEKLYVGNLADGIGAEQLTALFAEHGQVIEARIIEDQPIAGGERFAFVQMASPQQAQTIIEVFDGLIIDGRHLIVSPTRAKLIENKGGSYGGYGRWGKG